MNSLVLCDAHVHYYKCFNVENFLDSAYENFYKQACRLGRQSDFLPMLLLSEAKQDNWFNCLKSNTIKSKNWSFTATEEPDSILAINSSGNKLLIINGRQIVTSENLEILALATNNVLEDGKPLNSVIKWIKDQQVIPVIPWGFGKWWGKRGKILSQVLATTNSDGVFLGDNSGRPWFLGQPQHFVQAIRDQRLILPGSDPLPFAREERRPGSIGFYFSDFIDKTRPATCLRQYLNKPGAQVEAYMHCESLLPFLKNQISMQIRNRL
jgi:hypothetical protein